MAKKKKEDKLAWFTIGKGYSGIEGTFIAGETRQLKESIAKKLKKKIKPEPVAAPWDTQRDPLRIEIDQAQQQLTKAQSDLTQLRVSRDSLLKSKQDADASLDNFSKVTARKFKKNPRLALVRDEAAAMLDLSKIRISISDGDIEKAEDEAENISINIGDLNQELADRIAKEQGTLDTEDDPDGTEDTEETEAGQDDADSKGQAAETKTEDAAAV